MEFTARLHAKFCLTRMGIKQEINLAWPNTDQGIHHVQLNILYGQESSYACPQMRSSYLSSSP